MKTLTQFSIIGLFICTSINVFAQDFIVDVPSTYRYGDYLVPLKPGATHTFEVKVKNKRTDTYTVSID
ncbi:hypothetical protein, partial [Carboxylicivirga sp. N1Y90]|uniref:hypothetical protein n=1 Tax=Carboxylicivirga fragile TaxID=3417571 RepID=UPI003D3521B8|nr:hypothetical protein [Marinilabiliaceae bacterium N1Y90]